MKDHALRLFAIVYFSVMVVIIFRIVGKGMASDMDDEDRTWRAASIGNVRGISSRK